MERGQLDDGYPTPAHGGSISATSKPGEGNENQDAGGS
jgi:hypothetical protein